MNLKPASSLAELTQTQRETYARTLFDYQHVTDAMYAAATAGEAYIRLVQKELPANLKQTKAALQLVAKLKAAGYTLEWLDAVQPERVNNGLTGAFIRYQELRISWAALNVTSGPLAMPAE